MPSRFRAADAPLERGRLEGDDAHGWLSSDMALYVTIVTDTVSATLPKVAVMHLVDRIVANELQRRLQRMALQVRRYVCLYELTHGGWLREVVPPGFLVPSRACRCCGCGCCCLSDATIPHLESCKSL